MPAVPGYRFEETLYTSAYTRVYRGRQEGDGSQVIVKVPRRSGRSGAVARFQHEANLTLTLAGDRDLVADHRLEQSEGHVYLVASDPGGRQLKDLLDDGPLDVETFLWVSAGLVERLARIHGQRIIHKDLHPHNILVDVESRSVDILTLSIATRLDREDNKVLSSQISEGIPQYMSPEQTGRMNRSVDYRTDFYSLGVTFYEMLTGQLPFPDDDLMGLVHSHIAVPPVAPSERVPEIPRMLSAITMKLLAKNAEDRYQSCYGLLHDLEQSAERFAGAGAIADFDLGSHDFSQALLIPQKLYGREREIETLMSVFERVEGGACELMLVAGYSGIGKSALVREVHKPIVKQRGHFISGKFEQGKQSIPYFAFTQAFGDLMRQILTESQAGLAKWRDDLLAALGSNGQVVIDVIPEIEHIVGRQPPVPELAPLESETRFRAVFQSFLRVFLTADHPLALFLDDLQWADSASLQLIRLMVTSPENRYLFLIGAYRDNEVDDAHPLTLTLEEIRGTEAQVHQIELEPLVLDDITRLIADTVGCDDATARPLARLLAEKTGGNPFFLTQFIKSLHDDGLLVFDLSERRWIWNIDEIHGRGFTDNVVELMVEKLEKLPDTTRNVLTLASCVGTEFDLRTLAQVSGLSQPETAGVLWEAAQSGFISPIGDAYKLVQSFEPRATTELENAYDGDIVVGYKFFHDRIQHAAYSLISEDRQKSVHLVLGRFLIDHPGAQHLEDRVFEIANHFNLGIDLISDADERLRLARLNLLAGRKARDSTAYELARQYLSVGVEFLPADSWQSCHELALDLHLTKAESEYLLGDFERADQGLDFVLDNATSLTSKCEVHTKKAVLLRHAARYDEALDNTIAGLGLFDIELPDYRRQEGRLEAVVEAKTAELQEYLSTIDLDSLTRLPEMTDKGTLAVMDVLEDLGILGYYHTRTMVDFAGLEMVRLTLKHGYCGASSLGYTIYGMHLGSNLGDFKNGYQFGLMALDLARQHGNDSAVSMNGTYFGFTLNHWRAHLKDSMPVLKEAYLAGLSSGDLQWSGIAMFFYAIYTMFMGQNLSDVCRECHRWLDVMEPQGRLAAESYLEAAARLRGEDVTAEEDFQIDEDWLQRIHTGMDLALQHYFNSRIQLLYHLGDYQGALEQIQLAEAAGSIEDILPCQFAPTDFLFFSGLVYAALCDRGSDEERAQRLEKVKSLRDRFEGFAADCRDNFFHKYQLLNAEVARVTGDVLVAMESYDAAVDAARESGYRHQEAMAKELAGRLFLDLGRERIARLYLSRAYATYAAWGAGAKLAYLRETYPELALEEARQPDRAPAYAMQVDTGTLDLSTVMKAAQAISGEIVLARLLERMMQISMENAGAQKGVLLIERDGSLRVEAAASVDTEEIKVRQSIALEDFGDLPRSVITYVERTGETVNLNDAVNDPHFQDDPYIAEHAVRSIFCLPSRRQSGELSILYLENGIVRNAFTPDRVRILQLLSAQASISFENAVLYDTLEQKVAARTRELQESNEELASTLKSLREAQDRMVVQERLASLGSLVAGIAHELKNPLNFVTNFATLSVELAGEVKTELEDQKQKLDAESMEYLREVLQDLELNLTKISEHGNRADNTIQSMLEHSRGSEGQRSEADLNELLTNYTNLAYHGLRSRDKSLNVTIDMDLDPDLMPMKVLAQELGRVFLNIIQNACDAVQQKHKRLADPSFVPRIVVRSADLPGRVEVRIRDNGSGVPEEVGDKIFNPFFTTKKGTEGTGLGLSLSYDIVVQGHNGTITFTSEEGEYTEFVVTLPRSAS